MIKGEEAFDLTDVRYVKRIIVGTSDPQKLHDEEYIQKQADLLNRALNERPRGYIIGQEKNFSVLRIGEHQVVIQSIVYHVGFKRKPIWLDGESDMNLLGL